MSKTTPGVKFYPLIFGRHMVWALREHKKTQTRRPLRKQPAGTVIPIGNNEFRDEENLIFRPPARPGDIFWGREAWCTLPDGRIAYQTGGEVYRWLVGPDGRRFYILEGHLNGYCLCDTKGPRFSRDTFPGRWRPSIHMPFEVARIFLRIEAVDLARVQDITEEDAWAEGTEDLENDWSAESLCATAKRYGLCVEDARCTYAHLWDTMYGSGAYSWAKNPYVWTYTFRPISVEEASKCAIMPQ